MTRLVIDASVAAEYLLRTLVGRSLDQRFSNSSLLAPALIDVEVFSVLRRAVLQGRLDEHRAQVALQDLADWRIERIAHRELLREAWIHRHNVSAFDAFYVAVAALYEAPLLTADGPLSRAPQLGIDVQCIG
jgi:predicted nucleic acid-binding protein